jgi:aminoglycoside phosphotransferase (APT) family kinase protein
MSLSLEEIAEIVAPYAGGARVAQARWLRGGVSAEVCAVTLEGAAGALVLRRRERWPGLVWEHALAQALWAVGFPVARPRGLWRGEVFVMDLVDGSMEVPPGGERAMAACLARLHALEVSVEGVPEREDPLPGLRGWCGDQVEEAARAVMSREVAERRLVHGDFWPNNLLWSGQELAAVLDWEDAAYGDPLSNLACARVELEVARDQASAEALTTHYLALTGRSAAHLPVWDAYVASAMLSLMDGWGLSEAELARRRAVTTRFRGRALAALGARRA